MAGTATRVADRLADVAAARAALDSHRRRAEEDAYRAHVAAALASSSALGAAAAAASPPRAVHPLASPFAPTSPPPPPSLAEAPPASRSLNASFAGAYGLAGVTAPLAGFGGGILDSLDASGVSGGTPLGMTTTSISTNSRAVLAALRALQDKIRRVESDRARADVEVARLRAELATVREEGERSRREAASRAAAESEEAARTIAALRADLAASRASGDSTRTHLVEAHRGEVDRLHATLTTLRNERADLAASLARREEEVTATARALEHERQRAATLEELRRSAEDRAAAIARAAEDRVSRVTADTALRVSTANATASEATAASASLAAEVTHMRRLLEAEHGARVAVEGDRHVLAAKLGTVQSLNQTLIDTIPGSPPRGRRPAPESGGGAGTEHAFGLDDAGAGTRGSSSGRGAPAAPAAGRITAGSLTAAGGGAHTARRSGDRSASASARSRRSNSGSGLGARGITHHHLRDAYSGGASVAGGSGGGANAAVVGAVPFLPTGPNPTSHSVLANVQMSLSQPAAYGNRGPFVALDGGSRLAGASTGIVLGEAAPLPIRHAPSRPASAAAGTAVDADRYASGTPSLVPPPAFPAHPTHSPQWRPIARPASAAAAGSERYMGVAAPSPMTVPSYPPPLLDPPHDDHGTSAGRAAGGAMDGALDASLSASSVAAARGRRSSIGAPVAAMPEPALAAVVASLEREYEQLAAQYRALVDAAGVTDGAAAAATAALAALREKGRQLELLRGAEHGTVAGPVRSPVRNPEAAAKRIEALRTMQHLRSLAYEAGHVRDLDLLAARSSAGSAAPTASTGGRPSG